MKVILQQDYGRLGRAGDVVEVADGYGRNFLIPKGIAVAATPGNLRRLDQERARQARRADRELRDAQQAAAQVDGRTVTVRARAGEGGRLFGSVTAQQIAEAIGEQLGAVVDRRRVELDEPLRQVGSHTVTLRLHPEVKAAVRVEVVAEEE